VNGVVVEDPSVTLARAEVLRAARSAGLRPIDGPFPLYSDSAASAAEARRAAVQGFSGKWAIHPSQVAAITEAFTPSPSEVSRAQRVIDAFDAAAAHGEAVASLDGEMIDTVTVRLAREVVGVASPTS
jgi:malyl-CoA/(S)-citramalyl-CoA lyase